MKKTRTIRWSRAILCLVLSLSILFPPFLSAAGTFELTQDGMRYVIRDAAGNVTQVVTPTFNKKTGEYEVQNDRTGAVVTTQRLSPEAAMAQIKIVTPVKGTTHSEKGRDFVQNTVPVLRELPATDAQYVQLKSYIESNPGFQRTMALHLEARNMKINQLQQEVTTGVKDPKLAAWLVNDLKKPIYLEVGDSGAIYHDPKGFMLVQSAADGSSGVRDNASVNRLVIPPNSEVFSGGMDDPSAASVMSHELGHMIMDQLYERPNYPKTSYYGAHSKNTVSDEGFAISEGWAEAIEALSTKESHDTSTSWRIQTHKNIAENKYIFKNADVVEVPNDGILKTGTAQLSTEGVNASLFYKMLTDNHIQAPYSKVLSVFEQTKPQTYRDFLNDYVTMFPEDRSRVIGQFLENTKYTTVDNSAGARYKALHDAQQASQNNPDNAALANDYQAKLREYNDWKEQVYRQTVVDGKIDKAVEGGAQAAYSDTTDSQFRQVRLSETLLKGKQALGVGLNRAADSIKQSFSVKNLAITAGTSIAINLASQVFSGQKPSVKTALKSVASMQFVGNVMGSTLGAAAGHTIAPLIQAFVPIPVVGTIAGMLLPTLASIAGGQFGGNLGAGMGFKAALKALDPIAIAGSGIGSAIGGMLGAMIPIPVVGPILGSIVGGILGEKIFTGIARLFGYKKKQPAAAVAPAPVAQPVGQTTPGVAASALPISQSVAAAAPVTSGVDRERIDPAIDRIPYDQMHPNLRALKDDYEKAYRNYISAATSGDTTSAQKQLEAFRSIRERYRRALGAYIK